MNIIIEGPPRVDKTKLNTALALLARGSGMRILSNYEICFNDSHFAYEGRVNGKHPCKHSEQNGHAKKIDLPDLLDMNSGKQKMDVSGTSIHFQEAYAFFESRSGGGTRLGRAATYFALQSGKNDNCLTLDTQVYSALDLRIRMITQYRIWIPRKSVYILFDRATSEAHELAIPQDVMKGIHNFYDTKEPTIVLR